MPTSRGRVLAALFVGALALRAQITGVSPLIPDLRHDLALSHTVVGLLSTIPVLCMALFAPLARDVAARFGLRGTIAGCLLVITVAGLARAALPGVVALIVLTTPIGIGMGVAGALLPVVVKERFPNRPAFATGIYATGLQISAALSAAVAAPLASAGGSWRAALAAFSSATFGVLVAWLVLTGGLAERPLARPERFRLPLRSGVAWLLVGVFGLQSLIYYGLGAWLPDLYVERGWSAHRAGLLLSVVSVVGIPTGIALPWLADRIGSRRTYVVGAATLMLVALLGIELLPGGSWFWVACVGAAGGVLFAVCLTLPLDVADRPADVGSVAGLMLLGGYGISALGPLGLGAVRDLTGSFAISLWLLAGAAAAIVAGGIALTPTRLGRGVVRRPIASS